MKPRIIPALPILLVDDEELFLFSVEMSLSSNGIKNIEQIRDSRQLLPRMEKSPVSLVMLDINMPYESGLDLLPKITEKYPGVPVVIITAVNDVESAVNCMKLGAYDYIVKPVDENKLISTIRRGLELAEVKSENELLKQSFLREELEYPSAFNEIITVSDNMKSIFRYIEAIGRTALPVLVTGETGAGKELIARSIHSVSGRTGELVTVNVAGVDDNLFSDTLFGHRKGAFTSADNERKGLIERAESGTLFLDEIGDLSIESQVKLLRLLQDGSYYPLGSDTARLSDARIIVATHRDIRNLVQENKFRQDLFYRLKSHHIQMPPLRKRKSDIPLLIDLFLEKAARSLGKPVPTAPKQIHTLLSNYNFPGNIRELEGIIFDAVSRHRTGILSLESIRNKIFEMDPDFNFDGFSQSATAQEIEKPIILKEKFPSLDEVEVFMIKEALNRADGNQTIASDLLGISRRALNNRLQRKKREENF
ncbi:MAG: sigma-54 dependent transcriptional regulator [Ignavibacteriales bacterium]|nr:sigma-54 dependent transcriptional regulator [Ignavibacteriales bacterium]MCF8316130.1 sigma-54 dependent transcriptional regulator [Ignavibacteriales bacterium]MCF8436632.1 sigma-54 dependent transcriptional regulator [Ignavibacteriales bacterium]